MKKLKDSEKFLSDKRARKRAKRAQKKHKYAGSYRALTPYKSIPIDLLNEHCTHHWRGSNRINVHIPKNFSVITNPAKSVETFLQFAEATRSTQIRQIMFDHSHLKEVDLAAESVLDIIAMEMNKESRSRYQAITIGGHYPIDPKLKRYLRAVGIIKNLRVRHEYLPIEEEKKLKIFQMRNKKYAARLTATDATYKERAVADFVKYIDDCLIQRNRRLTQASKVDLSDYTGEILTNAEEHTDLDDWKIVGYLDPESAEQICEIAIFNFGKTIAETFKARPADSYSIREITPYLSEHRSRGLFGEQWREDDLLTLVALQGNVSSKNTGPNDDRGYGTVQLIEFFQRIYQECGPGGDQCAQMCVLSGNTHILFDGTYTMQKDKTGRMVIAFNKENDLREKPDKDYITNLGKVFFPGTIISIRFPMHARQTELVEQVDPI